MMYQHKCKNCGRKIEFKAYPGGILDPKPCECEAEKILGGDARTPPH